MSEPKKYPEPDKSWWGRTRDNIAFHIAPVLLGSDGRVWDGHHRICIAIQRGIPTLMVEIATTNEEDN